jgi:hypothetical protein
MEYFNPEIPFSLDAIPLSELSEIVTFRANRFIERFAEQSHGIQGKLPCDVRAPCGDRHSMVPPQKLIELLRACDTFILLSQGNQKQPTILSEVSMDAQTTGDSIRRHPGNEREGLNTIWWSDSSDMERKSAWFHIDPSAMRARFPKNAFLPRYQMQQLGNHNKRTRFRLLPGWRT